METVKFVELHLIMRNRWENKDVIMWLKTQHCHSGASYSTISHTAPCMFHAIKPICERVVSRCRASSCEYEYDDGSVQGEKNDYCQIQKFWLRKLHFNFSLYWGYISGRSFALDRIDLQLIAAFEFQKLQSIFRSRSLFIRLSLQELPLPIFSHARH